jgi:ribosomal-protein-alanine N-acetyltransferase
MILNLPDEKIEIGILERLEKKCFKDESWNIQMLSSHWNHGKGILYQSEDSEYIGYVLFSEFVSEVEIFKIGVIEEYRRKGIARLMMSYLQEIYVKIFLEVKETNFTAIQFYQNSGFSPIGIRKNYYPDGGNAILLNWDK